MTGTRDSRAATRPAAGLRARVRTSVEAIGQLKPSLLGAAATLAFILGFLGFQGVAGMGVLDSIYSSLQLFAFQYSFPPSPGWELNAARFIALGVSVYAIGVAISAGFRDEMHVFRARFRKGHTIVCGLGSAGAATVRALTKDGISVVAVEEDDGNRRTAAVRGAGVLVLKGDARRRRILLRAGLRRASQLVVMCGDDEKNDVVVREASAVIAEQGARDRPFECVQQIVDFDIGHLLASSTSNPDDRRFRLEHFNAIERGALAMLDAHPPFDDRGLSRGADPNLLVVGLGQLGGALIALSALRWSCVRPDARLRVTAVDRDPEENMDELRWRYRSLDGICDLGYVNRNVRHPDFSEGRDLPAFTSAYVCLGDDTIALTAGVALARLRPDAPVVVRTTAHPNLAELLGRPSHREDGLGGLLPFDVVDHVYRREHLLEFESIARAIHARHIRSQEASGHTPETTPSMRRWDELDEEFRRSSRRSAGSIDEKLARVGLGKERFPAWNTPPVRLSRDDVEAMAEFEHELWCDWRREQEKKRGVAAHSDLVPWAELPEESREYDRNIVRDMPQMLASVGYAVVRLEAL